MGKLLDYRIITRSGQTLIEVLAATGVAAVIIMSITLLAFSSLQNVQQGKNQAQASRYVSEGLEQVRSVRDQQGWTAFISSTNYPVPGYYSVVTSTNPWTLMAATAGNPVSITGTIFSREILLEDASLIIDATPSNDDGRRVTVSLYWDDSKGRNKISSSTILTKWR